MRDRITEKFMSAREAQRTLFMPYLTAGYPHPKETVNLLLTLDCGTSSNNLLGKKKVHLFTCYLFSFTLNFLTSKTRDSFFLSNLYLVNHEKRSSIKIKELTMDLKVKLTIYFINEN